MNGIDRPPSGHRATLPELTDRQSAIFDWIVGHFRAHGLPPTTREIDAAFGFRSPNATRGHLRLMARKGYLILAPGHARGIRLGEAFRCPCCGGSGVESSVGI